MSQTPNNDAREMSDYFFSHTELFYTKTNMVKTAILIVVAIIVAGLAYVLWFSPELIFATADESRKAGKFNIIITAIKWVSLLALPIILLMIFSGGIKNFYDKQNNGLINTDFFEKYISAEHTEVREWFLNGEYDKILALPVISSYFNKDITTFKLAHNPDGKTFYAFCEYQLYDEKNHGKLMSNVQTEHLTPKHIGEPQYSALMPLIVANQKAIDEVKKAETKEKNIVVTPNLS